MQECVNNNMIKLLDRGTDPQDHLKQESNPKKLRFVQVETINISEYASLLNIILYQYYGKTRTKGSGGTEIFSPTWKK